MKGTNTKYTREESISRRIEYLYNTSTLTDEQCRQLFTISKKQCLQNLIKHLAEDVEKL